MMGQQQQLQQQHEQLHRQQEEQLQEQQQAPQLQEQQPVREERRRGIPLEQDPRLIYIRLFERLAPLPQDAAPQPQQQVPQARGSIKQRKQAYKQAQAEYKALGAQDRLISVEEVRDLGMLQGENLRRWASTTPKHSKYTLQEIMTQIRQGDYRNFENLDNVMRNMVANRTLQEVKERFHIDENSDPQAVYRAIRADRGQLLFDPALRLGLSLAQRTAGIPDGLKNVYRALDEAMSTGILTDTLTKRADPQQVAIGVSNAHPNWSRQQVNEQVAKDIEANKAQQIQIAKRLLLMQLSNFQRIDTRNGWQHATPWDRTMAVALSHCSRVVLTMPQVQERGRNNAYQHQRMWETIFYQQDANGRPVNLAQDNARGSSTHSLKRRKVDEGGLTTKEKKVWFNFSGQRGMNCAIGGLGNNGVSRQKISNDGSCGHFYSMYQQADEEHHGAMLMGLESDAYGVTNQLGHTHDIHATGEKASSLGGQRSDEIGDKYGGRQCDLSDLTAGQIADWMLRLETAMKRWQATPEGMSGQDAAQVMALLTGRKLDRMGLNDLWNRLETGY